MRTQLAHTLAAQGPHLDAAAQGAQQIIEREPLEGSFISSSHDAHAAIAERERIFTQLLPHS